MKRKYIKWGGAIVFSPIILFILLCILIYLPPIQQFMVSQATRYASKTTGMDIRIERIVLGFPFDLNIRNIHVAEQNDTILYADQLKVKLKLSPLLRKKVELDGLNLKNISLNSANLIEGMSLNGNLGELFISAKNVALDKETAVIDQIALKDTHLLLSLNDTTAADTTASEPVLWKIKLLKAGIQNVSFDLILPLDTISSRFYLQEAFLNDGNIDLQQSSYSLGQIRLTGGSIDYNSSDQPIQTLGFDPAHISINQLNLSVDSAYYGNDSIRATLHMLKMKERSGIEIESAQGKFLVNSETAYIPSFKLNTTDSSFDLYALAELNALSQTGNGNLSTRIKADIGKNDLFRFLPDSLSVQKQYFPSAPICIRSGIDGNLQRLGLTHFDISIPETFRMQADGQIENPLDSLKRKGDLNINMETGNLSFINRMTKSFAIPPQLMLNGQAKLDSGLIKTDFHIAHGTGKIDLTAEYNLSDTAYASEILIDRWDIHPFLPQDSLGTISASLTAKGQGFDFFSPQTSIQAEIHLDSLRYGRREFSGIGLDASLQESELSSHIYLNDKAMDIDALIKAEIKKEQILATLHTSIERLELEKLYLTDFPLDISQEIDMQLQSDMQENHLVQAALSKINIRNNGHDIPAKDINIHIHTTKDSIRSVIRTGDLECRFGTREGLNNLIDKAGRLSSLIQHQIERQKIDHKSIMASLPDAYFSLSAGKDNLIGTFLSDEQIYYNQASLHLTTSTENGLQSDVLLQKLQTESILIDTISFKVWQDSTKIHFNSSIISPNNQQQEAFNILSEGFIADNDAQILLEYLNEKKETGAKIGCNFAFHEEGLNIHLIPDEPTLIYRPFKVNKNNYLFLQKDGRILTDISLYDEQNCGLYLYSTADSTAQQDITLALNRIDIAEFKRIIPYMPDIAGIIDAEAHFIQKDSQPFMSLETNVNKLTYNRTPLGDWAMSCAYFTQEKENFFIDAFVSHNNKEVVSVSGNYSSSSSAEAGKDSIAGNLSVSHLPLSIANAFIPDQTALLTGDLDGNIQISGLVSAPLLNGELRLDSTSVNIPQASLTLYLDNRPITIADNCLRFAQFEIATQGKSPFIIDGDVNMKDLSAINLDLNMNAYNFEVLNAKRTKEAIVYGKLYIDLNSTLKGTPESLMMRGNANILGSSNFTYILKDSPLTVDDRLNETVTFINFNDTTSNMKHELPTIALGGLDMLLTLHIDEAVQCRMDLNENGSNYIQLEGGGDLSFQYKPDGNMLLNGRYSLISGEMKYEMPIIPLKTFHIQSGSYIEWTGNIMNPSLNIKASERMRASVNQSEGSSRMVNFDVGVNLTNRLENLGFTFTLEAPDDGSVQNELASMSAEERNKLAVTMLVTGMYMVEGNTSGKGFDANSALNSFLQSEINNIAGSALKTIDINFGMETTGEKEAGTDRTDYNFQFAKRFWNNRVRVVIGGKISTGNEVQDDESFIDNISLEYRLDNSGTRYIKLFHEKNYESILDGEVTETGAGIVLRKKVSKLGELFIFRNRKKAANVSEKQTDK